MVAYVVYIIPLNAVNRSLGVEFRWNFAECRVTRDDSPWPLPSRVHPPPDGFAPVELGRSRSWNACTAFLLALQLSSPSAPRYNPPFRWEERGIDPRFPEFLFRPDTSDDGPRKTVNHATSIPFLSKRRRTERERRGEGGRGRGRERGLVTRLASDPLTRY